MPTFAIKASECWFKFAAGKRKLQVTKEPDRSITASRIVLGSRPSCDLYVRDRLVPVAIEPLSATEPNRHRLGTLFDQPTYDRCAPSSLSPRMWEPCSSVMSDAAAKRLSEHAWS